LDEPCGIGGQEPFRPQQAAAQEIRRRVHLQIAFQAVGTADGAKKILAVGGVREHVGNARKGSAGELGNAVGPGQALHGEEALIAAEQFIAAVAGEHDLYLLNGELGNDVGGDAGFVAERLVTRLDHAGDEIEGVRFDHDLVMIGRVFLRDGAGVRQFVVAGFFEADGERLYRFFRLQGHGGHDGAGIDSAAEKCSQGDIGDHT
jgi:hypothetical protein